MSADYQLDRDRLLARLGGEPAIFDIMVDTFLEDLERNCAALAAADSATLLQHQAHTFKGLLATVGDEAGREAAYALELRARSGNLAGVEPDVQALQARLRHVADVLRRETGR